MKFREGHKYSLGALGKIFQSVAKVFEEFLDAKGFSGLTSAMLS